jgi:hypothetical protein
MVKIVVLSVLWLLAAAVAPEMSMMLHWQVEAAVVPQAVADKALFQPQFPVDWEIRAEMPELEMKAPPSQVAVVAPVPEENISMKVATEALDMT